MRFRKKPVVIDAVQFFEQQDDPDVLLVHIAPDGLILGTSVDFGVTARVGFALQTLEGWHEVTPGDWIITGVKGERYPCKPDIFAATYEAVE